MSAKDFYSVLGVERSADPDSIKKAYRKLAMQYHPDKNPGDKSAEEKFKEAAAAYEVLSNPDKKAQYDRFGHEAFTQAGRGGGGPGFQNMDDIFANFGDIFADFFGGSAGTRSQRRSGPRRGSDLRYVTELSLKDVIEGLEKEIEFDVDDDCDTCHGSGAEKGSQAETCGTCGGRGQVVRSQGFFSMASTCPTCQGEGTIIKKPCRQCQGRGRKKGHRKIKLTIPAGVDTGTRLRVTGEGEGGYRGGPAGDLYVEVSVIEDERFQREENDLYAEVEVDYLQILLGAEIHVDTVTGKTTLQIPPLTAIGQNLKVPGQGIPSLRGNRRGDLYYKINVSLPKKLTQDEEKNLLAIAQARGVEVASGAKSWFSPRKK